MLRVLVFGLIVLGGSFAGANAAKDLEVILSEAVRLEKTRLPEMIRDGQRTCSLMNTSDAVKYNQCIQDLYTSAESVLSCESSPSRWQEMGTKDLTDMLGLLEGHPISTVSDKAQKIFDELVQLANSLWIQSKMDSSLPVALFPPPQWNLRAYQANFYNAHAGADGSVMISNKFWSASSVFDENEMRAILAHEISHVLKNHSLQTACMYVEWASSAPDVSLQDAQDIIRGDFNITFGAGKAWSDLSQRNEFQADAGAVELLSALEYDNMAMSSAVQKLYDASPKGGFTTGTHPDLLKRVEAAKVKAQSIIRMN